MDVLYLKINDVTCNLPLRTIRVRRMKIVRYSCAAVRVFRYIGNRKHTVAALNKIWHKFKYSFSRSKAVELKTFIIILKQKTNKS